MAERHVSVPKPFASGDISKLFTRYKICCKANDWRDGTPVLKLPTLLNGGGICCVAGAQQRKATEQRYVRR